MTSNELREKFLTFFESKGHARAPSSSLVPSDPSVLFTTAGMQQFKPYYLGEKSPWGDKVCSVQKCVRTSDIDSVGDDTHLTFFEMLGNFAFNNAVSKREVITWAHEFITKELGLIISHIAVFAGNADIPADTESEEIWKSLDANLEIRKTGADETFWGPTGDEGPCGPTTEIYVNEVEIWNIVFNEYYKSKDGKFKKLENFGIDTGMGFERLLVQVQGKKSIYDTDLFFGEVSKEDRIVPDHIKAALFMIADGIYPSNTGAGYILRRIIRRAVRFSKEPLVDHIEKIKNIYKGVYDLGGRGEIQKEEEKFRKTLEKGLSVLDRELVVRDISEIGQYPVVNATPIDGFIPLVPLHVTGDWLFKFYSTFGFPLELAIEELQKDYPNRKAKRFQAYELEQIKKEFNEAAKEHQKLSQTASAGMFKGGLSDPNDPMVVKLHTAHHLLLAALQEVLGKDVKQRGSNITPERLRMDFSFDRKMTDEEKKRVEEIVNEKITAGLPVIRKEIPRTEAEKLGAQMEFGVKYPDMVSVYFVGGEENPFSIEFCGGPHIVNTSELGTFKIQKEEASSQGVRRIKAVLL